MQGRPLFELVTVAFAIALNPPAVIAVILMLPTSGAGRGALAFVAGWMTGVFSVGAVVLLAGEVAGAWSVPERLVMALRLTVGMALLVLAVVKWRRHRSAAADRDAPGWMSSIEQFSAPKAFGVAAAFAALNPKTLALTVAGVVVILDAGLPVAHEWAVLLLFVAASSVSVAAPVVYRQLAPRASEAVLEATKQWLVANSSAVAAAVFLLLGVVLIGEGVQPLLSA